ncbi:FadR/GntR family transcriptional regulator [Segnochrobactrum spirostomi]|uniref:FadR family transcriptional regulator n=1 Tax=Segnochrobactrum spirostomi TaxID=2608987 RepID=A0A6A7XY10_9HYPH|nr:FadR/GntR family transcriptional regulator [Segnochrobactrum spirostomi]MQT11570.1 FadR family transcriptional regulator [Segnochrobactrum spirostomi]
MDRRNGPKRGDDRTGGGDAGAPRADQPETRRLGRPAPLAERVVAALSEDIEKGRLAAGARLPTEPDLAASFGVSRTVIREAVARLRADGILVSRQGAGVFVTDSPLQRSFRIRDEEVTSGIALREIFELRLCLEVESAALAAVRRTEADLEALGHWLREMDRTKHGEDFGVAADVEFHRTVALASGNGKIADFQLYLSMLLRQSVSVARNNTLKTPALVDGVIEEHRRLHAAIAEGAAEAARAAMRRHLLAAAGRLGLIDETEAARLR